MGINGLKNKNGRIFKFKITEKYKYVPKNPIFRVLSDALYYLIAGPILWILTKEVFGLEINGRENLENFEDDGAIVVSNHIHALDCAMIGLALFPRKIYYTTIQENFKIPFVRHLIKLLNAIPIPSGIKNKKRFLKALEEILKNEDMVLFYPEGYLKPYDDKLRRFHKRCI